MNEEYNSSIPSKDELLNLIRLQNRPMRLDGILKVSGVNRHYKKDLEKELRSLADTELLARMPGGLWVLPEKLKTISGYFQTLTDGGGIVKYEIDGKSNEIFIPALYTNGAWNKDLVRAAIAPAPRSNQGSVIEIIDRKQKNFLAVVDKNHKNEILCRPLDKNLEIIFLLDAGAAQKEIKQGDIIQLHPEKFLRKNLWQAALIKIYGKENRAETQEIIVKLSKDVPREFPALALKQAEAIPDNLTEKDYDNREDWRHLPFVTIDGANARDFDDAIHVEPTKSGWILRVAIADVSHYVHADKLPDGIDAEALRRGNSWYFPRSVEPMLPRKLCDNVCSLVPMRDRLAFMAELVYDVQGIRQNMRFAPIVMKSHKRIVYEDAESFFAGDKKTLDLAEQPAIAGMLQNAYDLYKILAAKRKERGSLDFTTQEPDYIFDDDGDLENIAIARRGEANKLIEEFMIAANEAVAERLASTGIPFPFRVHPEPEQLKLKKLYDTLKVTALESLPRGSVRHGHANPAALTQILKDVRGTSREYVVNRLCLQAMQQARYEPENIGHFGLASKAYCHFTSPIRRYADLLTHRALKTALGITKQATSTEKELWKICDQLNKLERKAVECEREMAKRLGCLLFMDKADALLKGTISGVTDHGVYVELDGFPLDGFITTSNMKGEWFQFDKKRQCLIGSKTGAILALGDRMEVRVLSSDMERLEIKLAPASRFRKLSAKKKRASPKHFRTKWQDDNKQRSSLAKKKKRKQDTRPNRKPG